MYYLQSRYYDPEMGRFISSDDAAMSMNALEDITAANLFAYCVNVSQKLPILLDREFCVRVLLLNNNFIPSTK